MTEIKDEDAIAVAEAITKAQNLPWGEGPYGLYDYRGYGATEKPFHVRDFRDPASETWGHRVARFDTHEEALAEYERLTRIHIGRAAIEAYRAVLPSPDTMA